MKTNLLLLDTQKSMRNLIFSAFYLSNYQKRKLKIVYLEDFNWINSSNYISVPAPNFGASFQLAEVQAREDFESAEAEIRHIIHEYLSNHPNTVPYVYEVKEYNRLEYISEMMEQDKDLLLMMSNYSSITEGQGGIINYPNILDKVDCPVLIIPDDRPYLSFHKMVYATALHSEDIGAIKSMVEMFSGDSYPGVYVFHHSKAESFDDNLKWVGFRTLVDEAVPHLNACFFLATEKDIDTALDDYIVVNDFDLIAVLKEKKGFFKDLFSSSHTHQLIRFFNKPVLIFHEKD